MSTKSAAKASKKAPKVRQKNTGRYTRTPLTLAIESRLLLLGMNHAQFAAALNVSPQTVTRWLKRGATIPEPRVTQIIELVGYLPVLDMLRRMLQDQREINLMLREFPLPDYLGISIDHIRDPGILADAKCSYDAIRLDAVGAHIAKHLPDFREKYDWRNPRLISKLELDHAGESGDYDLTGSPFE